MIFRPDIIEFEGYWSGSDRLIALREYPKLGAKLAIVHGNRRILIQINSCSVKFGRSLYCSFKILCREIKSDGLWKMTTMPYEDIESLNSQYAAYRDPKQSGYQVKLPI